MKTSALGELIGRLGLLWLERRPLSKESRARRKAKRAARKKRRRGETLTAEEAQAMAGEVVKLVVDGKEIGERVEPTIKARTSTKMLGVGGAFLATTAAAVIPNWDAINAGLMAACQSEYGPAIGLGMMAGMLGVNYVTTRFTKSPVVPGKI